MNFLEVIFPYLKRERFRRLRQKRVIRALIVLGFIVVLFFGIAVGIYLSLERIPENLNPQWGITFSKKYARELGLDWKQVYLTMLDDLKVSKLRIPAYWDEIEPHPPSRLPPEKGEGVEGGTISHQYDFTDLDWQISEAHRRDASVMLVIGRRLPRWPECHDPLWLPSADTRRSKTQIPADSEIDIREALLRYIRTVVERYRNHPAITSWQVENEPFLSTFGICPALDRNLFDEEINLVRGLSDKPIIVTESGELSYWLDAPRYADIVGVSLYRVVWNQYFGYFYWPLPSSYYRKKSDLIKHRVRNVIITEVQLEPWTNAPIATVPVKRQLRHFDIARFYDTIQYARKTGLSEIYLWGAEWWYWMKLQGYPEFLEEAKKVFLENQESGVKNQGEV